MGRRSVLRTVMKADVRAATDWKNAKVAYVYTLKKTRYWRLDGSVSVGLLYIATRQRKCSIALLYVAERDYRCPCLTCTVKIVQTGVKEVVYNLSYKV